MKKFRKLWDTLEDTKRIKFILQSTEALKTYEEEVRRLKEQHPQAAEHIPDTVNVLTKADLDIYDSHLGKSWIDDDNNNNNKNNLVQKKSYNDNSKCINNVLTKAALDKVIFHHLRDGATP